MSQNVKNNTGLASLKELVGDSSPDSGTEPKTDGKLSPLARCYISESIGTFLRNPSPNLSMDYRLELLTRKEKFDAKLKTVNEPVALIEVCKDYAIDGELFDVQKLLQAVQRQTLWMAAVDTMRDERTRDPMDYDAFVDDIERGLDASVVGREGAPDGLKGASDNEDAILGFAGDTEAPQPPTADEIREAVLDVNLWLNTIGSTLGLLPIPYTVARGAYDARGRPVWREVHDIGEAIEIQITLNRENLRKRNAAQAAARVATNEALFKALGLQAA